MNTTLLFMGIGTQELLFIALIILAEFNLQMQQNSD